MEIVQSEGLHLLIVRLENTQSSAKRIPRWFSPLLHRFEKGKSARGYLESGESLSNVRCGSANNAYPSDVGSDAIYIPAFSASGYQPRNFCRGGRDGVSQSILLA